MKLIRWGKPGAERPGVILPDGRRVDASAICRDYDEAFFATGGLDPLRPWVETGAAAAPTVTDDVRLGPPIARPSKIVCVGLNFRDHAAESKLPLPAEPVLFFKSTTAIVGPNDDVVIPKGGSKLDWEVELAIVVGRRASHVAEADAIDCVAGYVLHNDYSEREFQFEHAGQWVKGKSADTFAPLGPFLATPDEIADVGNLRLRLSVNGEVRQDGSTADMLFGVPVLVSYISRFMTLLPGDVISTGTPAGVGLGMDPPQYLRPGDIVELSIDGLGASRQRVRAFTEDTG
jgi:2-keto-4-pentenoate hydratase/2-oxohepta-3-ene-1,7-dioic acid hydratase in catechol pathway